MEKKRLVRAGGVVIAVLGGVAGLYAAFQAPGASSDGPKKAEEQFKNIQVLKGIPADQLIPTMQFIAASLNVECSFCHVNRAFDKDDKKPKQIARKMIEMEMAINKNNFEGHQMVTCNTCHRGSEHPMSVPAIADESFKPPTEEKEEVKPALPSVEEVIAKYVAAIGGKGAIGKLKSLSEKGSMVAFGGQQIPIEVYTKYPSSRASITQMPGGESVTAVNDQSGWMGMPGRPSREMSAADANGYRLEAEFALIPNLDQMFTKMRVAKQEKVGDRDTILVIGMREGQPPVRMNFDQESGLLLRLTRYTETALGQNPVQIDYADYRVVDGVKVPYKWTLGRPSGRFTVQIDDAKANVPIDPSKFEKPPAPVGQAH